MSNLEEGLIQNIRERLSIMLRILFNAEESFKVVEYLNDEQGHSSQPLFLSKKGCENCFFSPCF